MKKTIIIILVLIILFGVLGTGGYIYLKDSTKTVIRSELSERSKEFISQQEKKTNSDLRGVSLDKKRAGEHDFDSNRVIVENCYSLVIPFSVSDDRQNDPCVYYAILESPRGSMTTSLRKVGVSTVEGVPDVTFRRGKKEQYKEETLMVKDKKFLVFTDTTTNVEKTAFGLVGSPDDTGVANLFTVTLGIGGDDTLKKRQLQKIIESLVIE